MIGRRQGQQNARAESMYPGKTAEDVLFAFAVPNACSLQVGIVRHLVKVGPARADKSELVFWRGVEDQRSKCSPAGSLVVQVVSCRRFQTVVRAITVHAEVIRGPVIVVAKAQLIVR